MGDQKPGSILTPSQREFLRGETDIDPDSAHGRTTRSRIRNRLRAGMGDFSLILDNLDPEDIQKALELRASDLEERKAELETERGLSSAIGVVYLACLDRGESTIWLDDDTDPEKTFEKRANSGIRDAINRLGVTFKDVTTTLEVERGGPFDELPSLSPKELADEHSMMELQQAHISGIITDEQFFGAMEEQGRIVQRDE